LLLYEQQTIFRSDLLFLFNNLNIFLMNSNNFIRVRVQKKYFFEFKFEFGKMIEFFRVRSPAWQCSYQVGLTEARLPSDSDVIKSLWYRPNCCCW